VLLIAHRGASRDFPEQSAAAIRAAWAQGADGVEVDLRRMGDGRLLLHHDRDLRRRCGDPRPVAALDASSRRGLNACHDRPDLPPEPPLLLEELLELVPPGGLLFLELKEGPELAAPLARALGGRRAGVWVISFRLDTLAACRECLPRLPALWLREGRRPPAPATWRRWRRHAKALGLAGLDLADPLIVEGIAAEMSRAGLDLGAWTVDEPARAARLRGLGLRWLTTNVPGVLRAALGGGAHRLRD